MIKYLEDSLTEYKKLSLEIIGILDRDEVDLLDRCFDLRQLEIDKMKKIQYTVEEFTDIFKELGLALMDEQIKHKIQEMQNKLLIDMNKFSESKTASKNYTKAYAVDSIYFNKKY